MNETALALRQLVNSVSIRKDQANQPLDFISSRIQPIMALSTILNPGPSASLADVARLWSARLSEKNDEADLAELLLWKEKARSLGIETRDLRRVHLETRTGDLTFLMPEGFESTIEQLEIFSDDSVERLALPPLPRLSRLTLAVAGSKPLIVDGTPPCPLEHFELKRQRPGASTRFSILHLPERWRIDHATLEGIELSNPMTCASLELRQCVIPKDFAPSHLTRLIIDGGAIDVSSLKSQPLLQKLTLRHSALELASLGLWLEPLESLEIFDVSVETRLPPLPRLKNLRIQNVRSVKGLIDQTPVLEELSIDGCATSEGVLGWVQRLPSLRVLSVQGFSRKEVNDLYANSGRRFSFTARLIEEEIVLPGEEEYTHLDHFDNGHWTRTTERRAPHRT